MMRSTLSFFLIFIVLLGTVGVSYDAHYCCGVLVDESLSFVQSDLSCEMATGEKIDTKAGDNSLKFSQPCCENHHLAFQISDDYKDVQSHFFFFVPRHSFPIYEPSQLAFESENEDNIVDYSAPKLHRDLILLNASFLI